MEIAEALDGHSQMECLIVRADTESGLADTSAIRTLLTSKTCQLEELHVISSRSGKNRFSMTATDVFVQAVADNTSLNSFHINWEFSGEYPFSQLLSAVQSHPALESLCLHQRFSKTFKSFHYTSSSTTVSATDQDYQFQVFNRTAEYSLL